jgi:hypothetical protein
MKKGLPVGEPWLRRLFGCWRGRLAPTMAAQASAAWRDAQLAGLSLWIGESVGYAPRGAETAAARSVTHPTDQRARKRPGGFPAGYTS